MINTFNDILAAAKRVAQEAGDPAPTAADVSLAAAATAGWHSCFASVQHRAVWQPRRSGKLRALGKDPTGLWPVPGAVRSRAADILPGGISAADFAAGPCREAGAQGVTVS